ncbi:MAG: transcription-repair coupling factor, partial [Saprospiraceae bacterium]|nr:transcription-repair coupling factor [Saprospiraceae bacterium]
EYVANIQERLSLYTELDAFEKEEEIEAFEAKLRDRFGKVPPQVYKLFDGLRLRWICKRLGFERLILKNNKLRCYFVENAQSPYYETNTFKSIFDLIAREGHYLGISIKKSAKYLLIVKDNVKSLKEAYELLQKMDKRKELVK